MVFLPSIRCSWAAWARAAASPLAGTIDSPAVTAESPPSRSSLRQLNSWLAPIRRFVVSRSNVDKCSSLLVTSFPQLMPKIWIRGFTRGELQLLLRAIQSPFTVFT